ncbi:MAG: aspartyl protease family protein [Saprospiraceae bacterium]
MTTKLLFCAMLVQAVACNGQPHSSTKPLVLPIDYDSYILLKAKINNSHPANLLLDTGADELLLDEQYFNGTGIVIERSQQAQLPGAGAEPQVITVVLDPMTVHIDSIAYYPRYVPLMDLRSIVGEKADGIIGPAFLQPYLTEIDFENECLLLHTDQVVLTGFDSIKLDVRNNRYYLPTIIEAADGLTVKGMLQFDLGNGGNVILTSPTALDYDLETKISKKIKFFNNNGGAGGRIEGYLFRAKSLTIGRTCLVEPCIEWSTDQGGALAKSEFAGLLGNEILERFRVIFDRKNAVLYLKPKPNLSDHFRSTAIGMSLVNKRNSLGIALVTGLFEGGNAEKAGLQAGDRIRTIGDKKVTDMSEADWEKFRLPGEPVELEFVRGGVERKVWLERVEGL